MTLEQHQYTPSDAVDALIRYIEHFGESNLTVQHLLDCGYTYKSIVELFDNAVVNNRPVPSTNEEC